MKKQNTSPPRIRIRSSAYFEPYGNCRSLTQEEVQSARIAYVHDVPIEDALSHRPDLLLKSLEDSF